MKQISQWLALATALILAGCAGEGTGKEASTSCARDNPEETATPATEAPGDSADLRYLREIGDSDTLADLPPTGRGARPVRPQPTPAIPAPPAIPANRALEPSAPTNHPYKVVDKAASHEMSAESLPTSPTKVYMESFGVNGELVERHLTWVGAVGPDGLPHGRGSVTTAGVDAGGVKLAPVTWYDVEMDHGNIVAVDYSSRRPNFQK